LDFLTISHVGPDEGATSSSSVIGRDVFNHINKYSSNGSVCISLFFHNFEKLRINGSPFDGYKFLFEINRRLATCAGATRSFTTFRPVRFPFEDIVFRFLSLLYDLCICCFMCGTFVNYVAGVYNSYQGATLFVALTDETNFILQTVFQRYDDTIADFNLNGFRFYLLGVRHDTKDVVRYRLVV
jgi:hypothetical protein